jgi:hypothetical protein
MNLHLNHNLCDSNYFVSDNSKLAKNLLLARMLLQLVNASTKGSTNITKPAYFHVDIMQATEEVEKGEQMKTFKFVAFNTSGKKELGTVEAWGLSEAKRKIQQMGFYLASIKIQDSSVSYGQKPFSFFNELKEFLFA